MRAMIYRSWGGPETLEPADLPRPEPGPGELLVRVRASSVNPIDWKLASGKYRLVMRTALPYVPGFDLAGEVEALGPGVSGFAIGDRVHARLAGLGDGASAELARVGVDVATRMPASMEPGIAAALPLAGITALQALRDQGALPLSGAQQRVLVVGASGGVGHLAVQIAKSAGATVTGVCSARNQALVAELGADAVIDYNQPDPYQGQQPFDIVLDCVGSDPSPWMKLVAAGGRYLCTTPGPAVILRSLLNPVAGKKVLPVMLKTNAADLALLDRLFEEGRLRVIIDSRHPLDQLAAAWQRSISGRATGKIVVDLA